MTWLADDDSSLFAYADVNIRQIYHGCFHFVFRVKGLGFVLGKNICFTGSFWFFSYQVQRHGNGR